MNRGLARLRDPPQSTYVSFLELLRNNFWWLNNFISVQYNLQNLMRLRKCLVGEAKETVASLFIYPDNVQSVMKDSTNKNSWIPVGAI